MTAPAATTESLQLPTRRVQYSIRKSPKARCARIRVSQMGIEVVLPRRLALNEAAGLLMKHASWVERQLVSLERLGSIRREHLRQNPNTIMLRGTPTKVDVIKDPSARHYGIVDQTATGIRVRIPKAGAVDSHRTLENWLRRIARREIEARLSVRAQEMRCSFNRIYVMSQRTRWGSCSRLKNLSFNWKLIQAPPAVLDYVVIHELAHLTELNHSPKFWFIVRTHCPEFARWKKWLREHESILGIHRPLNEETAL